MSLWPFFTRSRRASRRALDPSPSVILPATSITVTSPTCRVVNLTLIEASLLALLSNLFYQGHFHARRLQPPHLQVVHERFHQKDSPARMPQQIIAGEWIGHPVRIKPLTLVGDPHRQLLRRSR